MIKLRSVTSRSASFEIINNDKYYTKEYMVYINNKPYKKYDTNVFTLFDLNPNTKYRVSVSNDTKNFKTLRESNFINIKDFLNEDDIDKDVSLKINAAINIATKGSVVYIPSGEYKITTLYLKSGVTIYLDKGAKLICETDRKKYPIIKGTISNMDVASFEGHPEELFLSPLSIINQKNVNIVGEGEIDCNSLNSDWYEDYHTKRIAYRPYGLYISHSENVNIIGITIKNTACWNTHPYYSKNLKFISMNVSNPKEMPTTDGIDPDMCDNVLILGVKFSVGDDCISIKSGVYDTAKVFKKQCKNIIIRNCLMNEGHGGVVLGSELSGGISNVIVKNCFFKGTDRGLRIKTRRGRGCINPISNITFDNILMDDVKTPFVVNMYYNMGTNGAKLSHDILTHEKQPISEATPVIEKFKFSNIVAKNASFSAGEFLGLPESPIEEISFKNVSIDYKEDAKEGYPVMIEDKSLKCREGFLFENVKRVKMKNVDIKGFIGKKYIIIDNMKEK